jgi:hypothetical protein
LNFERCDMACSIGWPDLPALSPEHAARPQPLRCWPSQNRGLSSRGGRRPAKRILVTASTSVRTRHP